MPSVPRRISNPSTAFLLPAIPLRESYGEHGKVKAYFYPTSPSGPHTPSTFDLRVLLKGGFAIASLHDPFEIVGSSRAACGRRARVRTQSALIACSVAAPGGGIQ